jgi:hypothetical protein
VTLQLRAQDKSRTGHRASWQGGKEIAAIAAQYGVRFAWMHRVVAREQGSAQPSEGNFPMNGIGKQAAFYRGFLPDDRCLVPLTVLLSATLALWLLVYLVAAVAEAHHDAGARTIEEVTNPVVYATQAFVATGSDLRGGGVVKPTV